MRWWLFGLGACLHQIQTSGLWTLFVSTLNQTWDDGMRKAFKMKMCAEVKSGWTACWRKNCSKGGGAHCYLILKKIVTFQVMKPSCVFYAMERRTFSCTTTSFWYLTLSKLNISTWNCKFVVMSISLLQETQNVPNMCTFLCTQENRMDQSWPNTIVIVLNGWPWFLLLVPHIYLWRKVVCFVL
jgi:hypothetical protein